MEPQKTNPLLKVHYSISSHNIFSANNTTTQTHVTGWKSESVMNSHGTLYINGETRTCELLYSYLNYTGFSSTTQDITFFQSAIPDPYKPKAKILTSCTYPTIHIWIDNDGDIYARSSMQASSVNMIFSAVWHY